MLAEDHASEAVVHGLIFKLGGKAKRGGFKAH
jgi:hypothetical protein